MCMCKLHLHARRGVNALVKLCKLQHIDMYGIDDYASFSHGWHATAKRMKPPTSTGVARQARTVYVVRLRRVGHSSSQQLWKAIQNLQSHWPHLRRRHTGRRKEKRSFVWNQIKRMSTSRMQWNSLRVCCQTSYTTGISSSITEAQSRYARICLTALKLMSISRKSWKYRWSMSRNPCIGATHKLLCTQASWNNRERSITIHNSPMIWCKTTHLWHWCSMKF